ncbi:MAG: polysulfide reductase NrfD [Burkholderiales bacterium]|nr:polysulfide reductase NrfD [Burkholderiales bacterium]
MAQSFNAQFRRQREWGWLLAAWLFLSGTGAGLFLLYELARLPDPLGLLALGLLGLGGAVLLLEQGSPLRAWRAISRVKTSWLSRGIVFVIAFVMSAVLALTPAVLSGLTWPNQVVQTLHWIAGLCALMIVLYPGFFLANNRSVPFWHTPMLPLLLLTLAATGASACALAVVSQLPPGVVQLRALAVGTILVSLILMGGYMLVMSRRGGAALESVRLLSVGPLRWLFWGGVVGVGAILPLALLAWPGIPVVSVGACMLVGAFLARYCLLRAGVYVPAAIAQPGLDFSRLNRTGGEFEREYAAAAGSALRD